LAPAADAATCQLVALKSGNYYVSAEFGWDGHGGGMLRARSDSIGPWEEFQIFALQPGAGPGPADRRSAGPGG